MLKFSVSLPKNVGGLCYDEIIQTKGTKMTEREILAQNILDRYLPFAFTCECNGEQPECASAMENPYLRGVADTVRRIHAYVLDFDPTH